MKSFIDNNGYNINVSSYSKNTINEIINDLTVFPYVMDQPKEETEKSKFNIYRYNEDKTYLIIPRYYGLHKLGEPEKTIFNPETINIKFVYQLREKQMLIATKCINYMLKQGGGLLSVPCGFGKTICALYMASILGYKTLVITHKSNLLSQWVKAIKNSLGLTEDRIGIIRQKKCQIENKDIVVGMIQTISKKDYKDVFNKFGFVIYDEAHHVCSRFFSKTLLKTGAKYTLSLTATPRRTDRLIKIMYWFIGGTIYRESAKINKNVIVKTFTYKSTDEWKFALKQRYFNGKNRPNTQKMVENLCDINTRNSLIINIVNKIIVLDSKRKILILSDRLSHLQILKKGVDRFIKKNKIKDLYTCHYNGATKSGERLLIEENGDIIFSTYFMCSEGVSIDHLNTVILATPKKDVEQSVGRIMRTVLETGDVRPMIIDICDDLPCISNWIRVRNSTYRKGQYDIENYYVTDNKIMTQYEYDNGKEITDNIHSSNMYVHKSINEFNKNINEFNDLFKQCDKLFNIKKKYVNETVYNDMEYTNLNDILFERSLTENDIIRTVVKDTPTDIIDFEEDVEEDNDKIYKDKNYKEKIYKDDDIDNSNSFVKRNLFIKKLNI
jgi:superfamily II DNA or RNA helicase